MEIDPNVGIEGLPEEMMDDGGIKKMMQDFAQVRDRLLEFQKIKKLPTHFSHTLKPLKQDGKNHFSKYKRFLCYFGSRSLIVSNM